MSAAVSPPTAGLRPSARRVLNALDTRSGIMAEQTSGPGAAVTAPDLADTYMGGADMAQGTCSIEGCEDEPKTSGLCGSHYARWRRYGDPHVITRRRKNPGAICEFDGCDTKARARGLCNLHWDRWRKHGDPSVNRHERTPEERFWEFTDRRGPDECWPWVGSFIYGYGHFAIQRNWERTDYRAPRFSFELHHRPLSDDEIVCHTCDNPPCVNPAHLYAGSHADNARDRSERGRNPRGNVKLTPEQVNEIRLLYAAGECGQRSLAAKFGVTRGAITAIVNGRTWVDAGARNLGVISPAEARDRVERGLQ